jgi:hypothetical protein
VLAFAIKLLLSASTRTVRTSCSSESVAVSRLRASDIAVGLGALLGIATPAGFNRPSSRNLMDFWERWRISLSQWIRRHLFLRAARAGAARRRPAPLLPASVVTSPSCWRAVARPQREVPDLGRPARSRW